jgi:hypothetical protein
LQVADDDLSLAHRFFEGLLFPVLATDVEHVRESDEDDGAGNDGHADARHHPEAQAKRGETRR